MEPAREREIAEIDTCAARSSHRRAVAVYDWIQACVVGDQEQISTLDEHAGAPGPYESLGKIVSQLDVPEPDPVDVLLDEELFAHVDVVARLKARGEDDVVNGRSRGVFFPVSKDALDYPRRHPVEGRRGEASRRQVMLGRIEDVAASPEIEKEIERETLDPEGVRQADCVLRLAVVAPIDEQRRRPDRKPRCWIDQQITVLVPEIEQAGERHCRQSRRGSISHVAVQPGIRDIGFRPLMPKLDDTASRVGVVRLHVPREPVLLYRRSAKGKFHTRVLCFGTVEIEQNETRAVAAPDVVDDLVQGPLAVNSRIYSKPVAEEAKLRAEFV